MSASARAACAGPASATAVFLITRSKQSATHIALTPLRTRGKQPRRFSVVHDKRSAAVPRSPLVPTPYALLALVALSGCRGCANDHPYVPPAADTPVAAEADAAVASRPSPSVDGGLAEPALV